MRKLFLVVALLFTCISFAQEVELNPLKIADLYLQELQVDDLTKNQFVDIIVKTGVFLYDKNIDKKEFNKQLKIRQIQISEILSESEFEKYLVLASKIEPNIKYRYQ